MGSRTGVAFAHWRCARRRRVWVAGASVVGMLIDCDSCTAGPRACADCVVSFLTIGVGEPRRSAPVRPHGEPAARFATALVDRHASPATAHDERTLLAAAAPVELDPAEERALHALAEGGLVPPIRMERAV